MIKYIIFFILILIIIFVLYKYLNKKQKENYNNEVGAFCGNCEEKNFINKCLRCFNCVWLKNLHKCVPGDQTGPYNKKFNNNIWYSGDEITYYY